MKSIIYLLSDREDLLTEILYNTNTLGLPNTLTRGTVVNQTFSDNEMSVDFIDSVRGKRVYLLSSFNNSDEIIRLNLAIDAAKRAEAVAIIPILPYFIYARGDKKDQPRGGIAAKVIASMLENSGATSIIAFDLHADQIQGFFSIPLTHIEGKNIFSEYISGIYTPNTLLCSPDEGGSKRVKRMKDKLKKSYDLNVPYVMISKTRTEVNEVEEMIVIGDVSGKDVIIIDDIIDTAGTLVKAVDTLLLAGAKSVSAVITHGVLSGKAHERIQNSKLTNLVVSNSLVKSIEETNKIKVISVSKQIAYVIGSINNSVSYKTLKDK